MTNKRQTAAYPSKIRNKWYFLVEQAGKTVNEICALYFVSRKTYYKWRAIDRGSPEYIPRKQHPQTKIKGEIKQFICEQKILINYSPKKMSLLLKRRFNTGFHHAVIRPTLTAADTIIAFREAEHAFPFAILGVQNDNGSENRGEFHQYLGQRGLAHYFIPKSSPNWDGAVERAHGVIDQEFYLNITRPWKTLAEYLHWYNYERIHLGRYLNGMIPIEKVEQELLTVSPLKVN